MTLQSRLTCTARVFALLAVAILDAGTSTSALAASGDLACRAALMRLTRQYFEHLHRIRRRCLHRVYTGKTSPLADCIGSGDDAGTTRSRTLRRRVGVALAKTCAGVDLKQLGFPSACSSLQPGIFDVSDLDLCMFDTIDAVVADLLEVESPASVLLPRRAIPCVEAVGLHGSEMVRRELRARTGCLLFREQTGESLDGLACRDQLPPWGRGTGDATADRKIVRGYISLLSAVPYACKTVKLAGIGYDDDCEDLTGGRFTTFDLKWCVFDQHRAMAIELVDLVFPRGPVCGNGRVEGSEECDDGFLCTSLTPPCTTGPGGGPESCDDGNTADNDGCNARCGQEFCGDGIVQTGLGEQCDDGPRNSDTAPDACRGNCKKARCGDGVVDSGETCDPPNGTTCRADCRPQLCGNGTVDAGEECDDGPSNSDTAPDACRTTCERPACGDGVRDPGRGEACDDENASNADACLGTCVANVCGDGFRNPGAEQCDDGNASNEDACRTNCVANVCGDGFVNAGVEECDDGNSSDMDSCLGDCTRARCGDGSVCTAAGCTSGPAGGPEKCDAGSANSDAVADRCRTNCAAPFCGDGVTDSGEDCDDGAANETAGACATDCKKPTICAIIVSVTSTETLGALKYQIDYPSARGEFVGSGLTVHCTSLVAGGSTNFFDDESARFVLQSTIALGGFTGPLDVGKCDFAASDQALSAGDFTLTVLDASTPQLVIAHPTLAITSIECAPGT